MGDILITDDERDIRELISDILKDEGYATRLAETRTMHGRDRARTAVADDPRYLAEGQQDGRDRHPQDGQARTSRHPHRHHLGPRQHRDRGRRDQAGGLRLHRKALQHRPVAGRHQTRDGDVAAAAREQRTQARRRTPLRDAGRKRGVPGAAQPAGQGHQVERAGDADRSARLRQGDRGALHPRPFEPRLGALSSPCRRPRSRPNGWKWCSSGAKARQRDRKGTAGAGARRGDLFRRGGRNAARHPVQDPARAGRPAFSGSAAAKRSRSTCG
jgi:hypothetical protein